MIRPSIELKLGAQAAPIVTVEEAAGTMRAVLQGIADGLDLADRLCGLSAGDERKRATIRAALAQADAAGVKVLP